MATKPPKQNSMTKNPDPKSRSVLNVGPEYLTAQELEKVKRATPEVMEKLRSTVTTRALTSPEVGAALVIQCFDESLDVNDVVAEMRERTATVRAGDMGRAEDMLLSQAHAMDSMFVFLSRRAKMNMDAGYFDAMEAYFRLALRTQNQCRMTVESLSAIKNPPVVFARQMNIANGPQQVNNGQESPSCLPANVTRDEKIESGQNKLLEAKHVQRLDTRTQEAAIRADKELEAVGEINRAQDG